MLYVGSKLLAKNSNIQVVNLIPTNLYGKYDNYNIFKSHVIPGLIHKTFIAKFNIGENSIGNIYSKLIIKGSGNSKRQFLYVDDFAKIIIHFVNCTLPKQCCSLIVSPPSSQEIYIKQLVDLITKEYNYKGKIIYDTKYSDGQYIKTTCSSEILEYIPNFIFTSLETGLKETINYFTKHYYKVRK